MHWVGSLLDARMDGDLRVRPVARAGALPVTAIVQATVDFKARVGRGPEAWRRALRRRICRSRGACRRTRTCNWTWRPRDLAELRPLVTSWRGIRARELPIEFDGSAEFRGTARGRLTSPALAGYLELHDFTTVLRAQAEPRERRGSGGARSAHAVGACCEGDVEYSAARESIRNGVLRRGGASIRLDASVALVNGNYDATQPFSAHVKVDNAEAGDLQALVGSSYPVSGQVSGDVQVEGTEHKLNGSGRISLSDGAAWRQAVRWATAEVNFTQNQAELRNIVVKSDAMQLTRRCAHQRGDQRVRL